MQAVPFKFTSPIESQQNAKASPEMADIQQAADIFDQQQAERDARDEAVRLSYIEYAKGQSGVQQ